MIEQYILNYIIKKAGCYNRPTHNVHRYNRPDVNDLRHNKSIKKWYFTDQFDQSNSQICIAMNICSVLSVFCHRLVSSTSLSTIIPRMNLTWFLCKTRKALIENADPFELTSVIWHKPHVMYFKTPCQTYYALWKLSTNVISGFHPRLPMLNSLKNNNILKQAPENNVSLMIDVVIVSSLFANLMASFQ